MKRMNKISMFIQGIVIFALCSIVLIIGYKQKDTKLDDYSVIIQDAAKAYIHDNGIKPKLSQSYVVKIQDLIDGGYIKEDDKLKEYCITGVIYSNNLVKDTYSIEKNCEENKEQEREE